MTAITSLFCVLFFASAVLAQIVVIPDPWPENVDCDVMPKIPGDTVHLPDPLSCNSFYKCVGIIPVKMQCPERLQWNKVKHVCDWPWNAKCQ
ncbi:uncharacterized protein LOC107038651 [Diachasma alloeum]|uniref:uncharacterized protein LOC107038651 n=1 Tax=Diachasma alloeum TaxID=454923 RepID=UPI0007384253|nr:uncharacterized protein LOC107038651 [Diachasma alloeum]